MPSRTRFVIGGTALIAVLSIAIPALAHCAKCTVSAAQMSQMMGQDHITLAKAIEAAEQATHGSALEATAHDHGRGLFFEVYTAEGGKVMLSTVNGKTGAVTKTDDVKAVGDHPAMAGRNKRTSRNHHQTKKP